MKSIEELRQICQPEQKYEGSILMAPLFRRFSIYITRLFLFTDISANQISLLILVLGLSAGLSFIPANLWITILAVFLLLSTIVLDFVDGEVAMYRNAVSLTGWYLAWTKHVVFTPWLAACISFRVYNKFGDSTIFIFGFSVVLFSLIGKALRWWVFYTVLYGQLIKSSEQLREQVICRPSKTSDHNNPLEITVKRMVDREDGWALFHSSAVVRYPYLVLEKICYQDVSDVLIIGAGVLEVIFPSFKIGPFLLDSMYLLIFFLGIAWPLMTLEAFLEKYLVYTPDKVYRSRHGYLADKT